MASERTKFYITKHIVKFVLQHCLILYFRDIECPEGPDVLTIVLAVIGGIVGIGLILLLLWKLLTAMVVRVTCF